MAKKKKSSGKTHKHSDHTSRKEVKKTNVNYIWPAVAVFMTIIFLIVVFNKPNCENNCDDQNKITGKMTNADEFIFVKADACTDACDEMEPVARQVAKEVNLDFRKITTPQQIPIPGYMVIADKETKSLLRPIQDKATFYNEVCSVTENEDICAQADELSQEAQKQQQQEQEQKLQDTPKQETPEVEVFVMSHCPYGTQMEKGILPVMDTLGDKADIEVKFVYYAMHGEKELNEQLRQYCIQKEQNDKFRPYLECFLEDGATEKCLEETNIDVEQMQSCVAETDEEYNVTEMFNDESTWLNGRFPRFNVHKDLNEEYGIRGSPGLVINGKQVQASRDPASLLSAVCSGFENKPEECNQALSGETPSAGFGYEGTAASSSGSCG